MVSFEQLDDLAPLIDCARCSACACRMLHHLQRRGPSTSATIHSRPTCQKLTHGRRTSSSHGTVEWGYAATIRGIDIRTGIQQQPDHFRLGRRIPDSR